MDLNTHKEGKKKWEKEVINKTERDLSTALGLVDDLQCKLFSRGPEQKQCN